MSDSITFRIRYQRIYPVYCLVRNPASIPAEGEGFNWEINSHVRFTGHWSDDGEIMIAIEMRVTVPEEGNEIGPVLDVVTVSEFLVLNLKDAPRDESGNVILPKQLAGLLLGSVYSTMRGYIAAKAEGLLISDVILPVSENVALYESVIGKDSSGIAVTMPDPSEEPEMFRQYAFHAPSKKVDDAPGTPQKGD